MVYFELINGLRLDFGTKPKIDMFFENSGELSKRFKGSISYVLHHLTYRIRIPIFAIIFELKDLWENRTNGVEQLTTVESEKEE